MDIQRNLDILLNYRKQLVDCIVNKVHPNLKVEVLSSATLQKG